MNPLKRHKQYKNCPPEETISTIKSILNQTLHIDLKERSFIEKNGLFHSCRLILSNDWITPLNIGTNGKGMTEEYSRASAHGEMMERIQNGALLNYLNFGTPSFWSRNKDRYSYLYNELAVHDALLSFEHAHDEVCSTDDSILKEAIDKYIRSYDNEKLYEITKGMQHCYIPYYSVKDKKEILLPIDIILNNISSNGMCSGNTPEEAIVQGLSEILERFIIRKIYFENITFPQIPKEYFQGTEILKRINDLEYAEHYTVTIVDCSCGLEIPAIGVIIRNNESAEYQFHIGVDPSPITALERSLTELYQGRTSLLFKKFDLIYQSRLLNDIALKEKEINETFVVSTGSYPLSLFYPVASYDFEGFNEQWGHSDKTDLSMMINLIHKLGYQLFIRDNSILGFPAYSLYVPGMNELYNIISLNHLERTFGKYEINFIKAHNLENLTAEETLSFLDFLNADPDNQFVLRFTNPNDTWMSGNNHFLCSILYFRNRNYKLAIKSIEKAIERTSHTKLVTLYKCFKDYMNCVNENISNIDFYMECIYDKTMYETVKQCLTSSSWGSFFNLSNCFKCKECKIKDECLYIPYLLFAKQIQKQSAKANINQMKLQILFNFQNE